MNYFDLHQHSIMSVPNNDDLFPVFLHEMTAEDWKTMMCLATKEDLKAAISALELSVDPLEEALAPFQDLEKLIIASRLWSSALVTTNARFLYWYCELLVEALLHPKLTLKGILRKNYNDFDGDEPPCTMLQACYPMRFASLSKERIVTHTLKFLESMYADDDMSADFWEYTVKQYLSSLMQKPAVSWNRFVPAVLCVLPADWLEAALPQIASDLSVTVKACKQALLASCPDFALRNRHIYRVLSSPDCVGPVQKKKSPPPPPCAADVEQGSCKRQRIELS